jgi:ribonuclease VapC
MIVDTSAILAILLGEKKAGAVADALTKSGTRPSVSPVNYVESLIILADRKRISIDKAKEAVAALKLEILDLALEECLAAAEARLRFPLNLGDCFAYAAASVRSLPLLAVDSDFGKSDAQLQEH